MEREQIESPAILSSHGGETRKEETLLRKCLRNSAAAVHPRNRVQHTLAAVRQDALGLFAFHAVLTGPRGARCHDQAHLAGFQRTRNQILQYLNKLVLCPLRVDVDAKTTVEILRAGQHLSQAPLRSHDRS